MLRFVLARTLGRLLAVSPPIFPVVRVRILLVLQPLVLLPLVSWLTA